VPCHGIAPEEDAILAGNYGTSLIKTKQTTATLPAAGYSLPAIRCLRHQLSELASRLRAFARFLY
jgi:hypothetical protein